MPTLPRSRALAEDPPAPPPDPPVPPVEPEPLPTSIVDLWHAAQSAKQRAAELQTVANEAQEALAPAQRAADEAAVKAGDATEALALAVEDLKAAIDEAFPLNRWEEEGPVNTSAPAPAPAPRPPSVGKVLPPAPPRRVR